MSEKQALLALDNMETSVILLNEEMRIEFMNVSAEALLERSRKRIRGSLLEDHVKISGLSDVLRSSTIDGNRMIRRENRLEFNSGKSFTVNLSVTPISESALLLEMRQIDRHLDISQSEQLFAEHQATRKLLRGLAHEIKNPLGGIRGAAQLLAQQYPDNDIGEYTQIIIREADRLRTLIDQMVGPQNLSHPTNINLHSAVEHVFKLAQAEVGDQIQLVRDYDPSIPDIFFDKDQLIQSVLNITRNAIEAVGKDGGAITLRTRVLRHYNLGNTRYPLVAQISIIDTGPGIPENLQSEVFFPMVTTKATGTGLGLSITQSLVQHNKGLVKFTSRPGHTCFELLVPIKETNAS